MEDVYVIKVKTKPALATLYPSERRYSASTVGGLSLVHLIFGLLNLLLGSLGKFVQGFVLFFSCLAPTVSGILAWKRWYIDRNITIFFYCCIFSSTVSVCCFIASLCDIFILTEKAVSLSGNLNVQTLNQTANLEAGNESSEILETTLDISENATTVDNSGVREPDVQQLQGLIFLLTNIAVACLLELLWSLLSLSLSLKGLKNKSDEDGCCKSQNCQKIKMNAPTLPSRPDIILMNKHICCSMQSLDSLQSLNTQNLCPKLPLPESNKEFKERVDKFLTNQVNHRNSEGT